MTRLCSAISIYKFEISFIVINHKLSFPSAPIGNLVISIGVEILDKSTRG
ncbi:hypothetical protein VIN01S_36400 [Vibrio inusitatus NBRC 102082]|uniref:Uncharacterized protein n=1 Tax=Vibrio inusitatus NBRC 102082 TaxID=1219070 RepID=A0A4Y3I096_9VIBR|nr:hypothetical protein VIN01S_36400 [Vibrio inusitatus NBRC 102082]